MDATVVAATGLTRVFRDGSREVRALSGVDLTVAAGEFVALMESSGSGKTTLLNIVAGIDRASAGDITVLGLDYGKAPARSVIRLRLSEIGFVFQNVNLLPDLRIAENVALPLEAQGVSRRRALVAAAESLETLGIGHLGRRYPVEVSGGERQRAAICRAVVGGRRLLLADEPTEALDSATGATVVEAIGRVCATGVAAVVSTHNAAVGSAASRVVRLRDGRVVTDHQPILSGAAE